MHAARLKRASLLKVALVAIVLAGVLLGLAAPSKAQSEPLPDLTVLKTGPATASQGDTVTWDITMSNIGSGSAVVAALPPGSDQKTILQDVFISTTREDFIASRWIQEAEFPYHCFGGSQQPGQIRLGWFLCPNINQPVDVIPPGGVRSFTVTILGVSPTVESTVITNCATVDPDNVIEESNESNNISCMVTVVGDAVPMSKAECKNGGYKGFGFESQGQCVAFVQRGAKNSQ